MLNGVLAGHTEEEVNLVNAPALAEERGIEVSETKEPVARDFTDLVRVTVVAGGERARVVGTTLGRRHRPHLLEAWGQRFNLQIDAATSPCSATPTCPGMVGRVGTDLRRARRSTSRPPPSGASPTARPHGRESRSMARDDRRAGAAARSSSEIVASDGFVDGRTVSLQ